ncbi:MAG: cysteine synthase A [Clostridiales bacterium]|nr:cysteine synthase A [Clostridiales bacterium]
MKIYDSIENLIGNTPLFEPKNLAEIEGLKARLLVKLEYLNPAGSIKDRAALYMIADAEEKGLIKKGATIIEPTSGNTGIGIAAISAKKGYKTILTMPDTMSVERRKLLKAYGAEIVLTDGKLGMNGAVEKAKEIQKNTPNSIILSQFDNPANIMAHYKSSGPEIWIDTDGKVDYLVAGIGTGGTISGTGKYLKEQNSSIKVIGVEPSNSPLITCGKAGAHKLQGIGANFIPENFDETVCDSVCAITDEDAFKYARIMANSEGILVGISSGAAIAAAAKLAKLEENAGKIIVAILPDTGDRYLSTELFSE